MSREEWDERASALFEAGRRETPSATAKRRTLEQALARVEQRRARPGAPFAVVALAAALLGAVWLLPRRHEMRAPISAEERRPRASAPPAEPRQSVLAPAATPAPAATEPRTTAARERLPDAGSARRKRTSKPASVPPATLEAELAVLDRARTQLAAGEARAALASLDHYDTTLRGTHLALEARLLRIQALAVQGDRARAAALARQLVTEHPDSPLAERARRFTALDSEPNDTTIGEER